MNSWLLLGLANVQWVVLVVLSVVGLLGVLAVVSPTSFATLARGGGKWFDTQRVVQALDRPINIDNTVMRYSRLFGVLVVAAVVLAGYVFCTQWFGQ